MAGTGYGSRYRPLGIFQVGQLRGLFRAASVFEGRLLPFLFSSFFAGREERTALGGEDPGGSGDPNRSVTNRRAATSVAEERRSRGQGRGQYKGLSLQVCPRRCRSNQEGSALKPEAHYN